MFQWFRRLIGRFAPAESPPTGEVTEDTCPATYRQSVSIPADNRPPITPEGTAFLDALLNAGAAEPDLRHLTMDDREFVSDNLRRLHQGMIEIPMLPGTLLRIRRMTEDPEASVADISAIFKDDPTLSAELLRLANSSYISYIYPTLDLHQAVVRVGFAQLHGLVIMFSLHSRILHGCHYRNEALWITELSLTMARTCQLLAADIGIPPEEAFTLGLMHHIEHLVILGEACKMTAAHRGRPVSHNAIIETVHLIGPQLHGQIMKSWGMDSFVRYYTAAAGLPENGAGRVTDGQAADILPRLDRLQQILIERLAGGDRIPSIEGFDQERLSDAISTVVVTPLPPVDPLAGVSGRD